MSCEKFDPACPSCRPVLLDPETGRPLPEDHPAVTALSRVWNAAPFEEQEAFWHCTVKSSQDPVHRGLLHQLMLKLRASASAEN